MGLNPALQTLPGRRAFIRNVISAFERDDPIGSDLAVDEDGFLAAALGWLYERTFVAPHSETEES